MGNRPPGKNEGRGVSRQSGNPSSVERRSPFRYYYPHAARARSTRLARRLSSWSDCQPHVLPLSGRKREKLELAERMGRRRRPAPSNPCFQP
jgi:hypothetical protein